MINKHLYLPALLILLYGCSDPQSCPELVFDSNEKLTYLDGELYTGRCMVSNGEIKRSIQQYLNGVDHGNWIFYYENGNLEAKGNFKDGKRIGVWKYYYSSGIIRQKSRYSNNGERKGKWTVYDSIGNLISSEKY